MPRPIDISKVVKLAAEAKLVNLDLPVGTYLNANLIGAVSAADEPWDLICADWITMIRKGPRLDSLREITVLADSIRGSLGVAAPASRLGANAG